MTYHFPEIIDSTILTAFRSCRKKAQYEFFHNLASARKSVHLHFGGAVARAMEVSRHSHFVLGHPAREAEAEGINAGWAFYGNFDYDEGLNDTSLYSRAKNWPSLVQALDGYFKEWPLGSCGLIPYNGKEGIEFSFAIPIPGTQHPTLGGPILYGGRFDLLGEWNSLPTIVDEKTAGSFGESWFKSFDLRNQFLGYTWAARQYGVKVEQVLVRGIAVLMTEIKYLEVLKMYPDYIIDRWYAQLIEDLNAMTQAYEHNKFSYDFADACTSYGGCPYLELCKSRNPKEWFSSMFTERNWNPLRLNPELGD
jgi:hypothetical protein